MTTDSCKSGATLSRMNFFGYVGHVNTHYCLMFSSTDRVRVRVRVRIRNRLNVWLVTGYAHVFVLVSVAIFTIFTFSNQ